MRRFHIHTDDHIYGPYKPQQIRMMRDAGMLQKETLAIGDGDDKWVPVEEILDQHLPIIPKVMTAAQAASASASAKQEAVAAREA